MSLAVLNFVKFIICICMYLRLYVVVLAVLPVPWDALIIALFNSVVNPLFEKFIFSLQLDEKWGIYRIQK